MRSGTGPVNDRTSVRPGWRWLHVVMGIIFAFGAGWSFAQPYDAF